jgi:cytochrome c1
MKKRIILTAAAATLIFVFIQTGCQTPASIAAKTGAQLWAENCTRCHYNPDPKDYADHSWELIGRHMKIKASLTDTEVRKIVAFLKTAN